MGNRETFLGRGLKNVTQLGFSQNQPLLDGRICGYTDLQFVNQY